MPRLFTGLEVPRDVQLALSLKRGGIQGARWIEPENYHITLRFIGDVDNHTAYEVAAELDRLSHSEAFTIRLSHLGTFGGDKPRENLVTLLETLQRLKPSTAKGKYFKSITISSTMGPGVRLDTNEVAALVEA